MSRWQKFKNYIWQGWRYELRWIVTCIVITVITDSFWAFFASYMLITSAYSISEILVEDKRREDWNDAMHRLPD